MNLSNFPMSPPSASNFAVEHDLIFYALTILTVFFTLLVGFLAVFFAIKYRAGNKVDRSRPMYENLKLELTWTIIPLIGGLILFYFGAKLFIDMRNPPPDAQEVFVVGKQWMWHVQHSNGVRENNTLHVPLGKPVKVTMISQDVLHAFYIPAFRTQMHVVPGRYTQLWFIPTQTGEYHLFCGMYCGTQHSEMGGKVVVLEPREWAEWSANGGEARRPVTMEQAGQRLYAKVGCNNCHGDKSTPRGPSLLGLYSKNVKLASGEAMKANEEYIRQEILDPHKRLTAGYDDTMPIYKGQLSESDVLNLIAFIKAGAAVGTPVTSSPSTSTANQISSSTPTNSAAARGAAGPSVGAVREEIRN
jgi:cytochrome c oxidase subunit II